MILFFNAKGQVVVSPNAVYVKSEFTPLPNIEIAESKLNDIASKDSTKTLIIELAGDFIFNTGASAQAYPVNSGSDLVVHHVLYLSENQFKIVCEATATVIDTLRISGLEVKAVSTVASAGQLKRMGNANINGLNSNSKMMDVLMCPVSITAQPEPASICEGEPASFSVSASGVGSYQWQIFDGSSWIDLIDEGPYSNSTNPTLTIANTSGLDGAYYRCALEPGSSCLTITDSVKLTALSLPEPEIVGKGIVCQNEETTYSTLSGMTGYSWTVEGGLLLSGGGTTNNSATIKWSEPGIGKVTVNYANISGCVADATVEIIVTVKSMPNPVISGPPSVCEGETATYGVVENPENQYDWSVTGGSILSGAASNEITIQWEDSGTGIVWLTEEVSGVGCPVKAENFSVTIQASTPATISGPHEVCENQLDVVYSVVDVIDNTYAWTVNGGAIVAGEGSHQVGINWGAAGSGTIQIVQTNEKGCASVSPLFSVLIKTIPNASATSQEICSGETTSIAIGNPNNVPGTTFEWIVVSSDNINGAIDGGGNLISQKLTSADGSAPGTATYQITPKANGCEGTPITVTATVNPVPDLNVAPSAQTICNGSAISLSLTNPNGVLGTTYTWSSAASGATGNTQEVSGSSGPVEDVLTLTSENTPGSVIYTATAKTASCTGTSREVIVTVNPVPNASATSQEICSGETTSIAIGNPNNVPGTTFEWIVVSSDNINGAIDGGGNLISQKLTSADGSAPGTATYQITPKANGCEGTPITVTATANPVPNAVAEIINPIVCNDSVTQIVLSNPNNVTGATFSWTYTADAGVSGAANGFGNEIRHHLSNSTASLKSVAYVITPESSSGCAGSPITIQVMVNPVIEADAGSDQETCEGGIARLGGAPSAIGGIGSYKYYWTGDYLTGSSYANPTAVPLVSGDYTYSLIVEDANGCVSDIQTTHVKVSETVTVQIDLGDDFFICAYDSIRLHGIIGGGATEGTWSAPGGDGKFIAPNELITHYIPGPNDILNGNVRILLTSNDPSGPCGYAVAEVNVKISPEVFADAGDDLYICEGQPVQLGGNPTAAGGSGFFMIYWSGPEEFKSSSGNPVIIPGSTGRNVYSVIVTDNKGCKSDSSSVSIFVNEKAIADAGKDYEVCVNDTIKLEGHIGGGATDGHWLIAMGAGSIVNNTVYPDGRVTADYVTDSSDKGEYIFLTLVAGDPDGEGESGPCSVISDNLIIKINLWPEVRILNLPEELAVNGNPLKLFGYPLGGTFSGDGIIESDHIFDPSIAGGGVKTVYYSYTSPTTGCFNSVSQEIMIHPAPNAGIIGLDSAFCYDQDAVALKASPEGGIWSGPGISFGQNIFRPSVAGVGAHRIIYTYTDDNSVTVQAEQTVRVHASPEPSFFVNPNASCVRDSIFFKDETQLPNGDVFNDYIERWEWDFGDHHPDSVQNPKHLFFSEGEYHPGEKFVALTVVTRYGCSNSHSGGIVVGSMPKASFEVQNVAHGDATSFINRSTNGNPLVPEDMIIEYHWDFDDLNVVSNQKDPVHTFMNIGEFVVNLQVKTNYGCVDDTVRRINIIPLITEYPYVQDFEGISGWVPDAIQGSPLSWELGTPAGNKINRPNSGKNAWITKVDTIYEKLEKSYVNGPAFDLTRIERPMLSFKIWCDVQDQFDGAVVQYSYDGGINWLRLGERGQGLNWYNFGPIVSRPGEDGEGGGNVGHIGWTGSEMNDWVGARYDLSEIATDPRANHVRFRVGFSSDGSDPVGAMYDGFAFDDFVIESKSRVSLIEHFTNAPTGAQEYLYLNSLEDVVNKRPKELSLKDFEPQEAISLHYQLNVPQLNPIFDNVRDPRSRVEYYDFFDPHMKTIVDGANNNRRYADLNASGIVAATLKDPQFEINATVTGDITSTLTVQASFKALNDMEDEKLVAHVAVVEREIANTFGITGVSAFRNVLKKMIPDATGTEFIAVWKEGDSETIEVSWDMNRDYIRIYDSTQLAVIVFLQNKSTKEIYQAKYLKAPVRYPDNITAIDQAAEELSRSAIYPVPVSDRLVVEFDKPLENDYFFKVVELRGLALADGKIEKGTTNFSVDASSFPAGVNILILTDKSGSSIRKKFMVIH